MNAGLSAANRPYKARCGEPGTASSGSAAATASMISTTYSPISWATYGTTHGSAAVTTCSRLRCRVRPSWWRAYKAAEDKLCRRSECRDSARIWFCVIDPVGQYQFLVVNPDRELPMVLVAGGGHDAGGGGHIARQYTGKR